MMSLHSSMHSSQMYTPGPAINFFTCFCDFPQKLHFTRSPPSPNFATSVPRVLLSVVPVAHPYVLPICPHGHEPSCVAHDPAISNSTLAAGPVLTGFHLSLRGYAAPTA